MTQSEQVKKDFVKYSEYLNLNELLSIQNPISWKSEKPAHHELLFIITHQTHELWFKQILFEIDSVKDFFIDPVNELSTLEVIKRLNRITIIIKVLTEQMAILETMTSVDFTEFRDLLCPASGFQSVQFRLIEDALGLKKKWKTCSFREKTLEEDTNVSEDREEKENLFQCVEHWLESIANLQTKHDILWSSYKEAAKYFLDYNQKSITEINCEHARSRKTTSHEKRIAAFETVFNEEKHNELIANNERKFSLNAIRGAILIFALSNKPQFNSHYQVLSSLIEIDTTLMKWRFNHTSMVQKMIGSKCSGTGGSSGYSYLRSTLNDKYKPFLDFTNLSIFMLPSEFTSSLGEDLMI